MSTPFGSGTRPWTRGTEATRAASATVPAAADLLVTSAGNVYAGDGITAWKSLPRLARLTDLAAAAPAVSVPGAPTGVVATAKPGAASVAFAAPASNGGSAITGYTVTSSPGGLTATGPASPITVAGLTNGTAYTFTVKATNSAGSSAASAASTPAVTPVDTALTQQLAGKLDAVTPVLRYATKVAGTWQTRPVTGGGVPVVWLSSDGSQPPGGGTVGGQAGAVDGLDLIFLGAASSSSSEATYAPALSAHIKAMTGQ